MQMGSSSKKVIAITAASVLTLGIAYFFLRKSSPKDPKPEEKKAEEVIQVTEEPPSTDVQSVEEEAPVEIPITWP